MAKKKSPKQTSADGNFVSEWFGHRIFPNVVSTPQSIHDQQNEVCPFLTKAVGEQRKCIKSAAAKGVCTISCASNGQRQDWLVCPYRALSDELVSDAIACLFVLPSGSNPFVTPAATLAKPDVRDDIQQRLSKGQSVFIYFDKKTSGELSIPATDQSPEFSFDVTIVELLLQDSTPHVGRFGILEIQTMDFHGSYRDAVRNLTDGLRMHPTSFGATVQANQWWLSQGVEGPNIANVFKRTFYQMMFKFALGDHKRCAGCVLAIPESVWDSWQKHLGSPSLRPMMDGNVMLVPPEKYAPESTAWIYVFDPDSSSKSTPSPIAVRKKIRTDAASISYWALQVAPAAALANIDAQAGFLAGLSRRLRSFWPELAATVVATVDVAAEPDAAQDVSLTALEKTSSYKGPSDEAVASDPPDE
jgi:hypothetical protein